MWEGWAGGVGSRNHAEVPLCQAERVLRLRARSSTSAGQGVHRLLRAAGSRAPGLPTLWTPGLAQLPGWGGRTVASERGSQGGGSDWRAVWGARRGSVGSSGPSSSPRLGCGRPPLPLKAWSSYRHPDPGLVGRRRGGGSHGFHSWSRCQTLGAGGRSQRVVRVRASLRGEAGAPGPCQRMVSSTLHGDRAWTGPEMTFCLARWLRAHEDAGAGKGSGCRMETRLGRWPG